MGSLHGTPVRYREDTGWEFRCAECTRRGKARFWPLTDDFWWKSRGMLRCRACWQSHDRERMRRQYRAMSEAEREVRRQKQRAYRKHHASPIVERLRWERVKSDPILLERERERGRERQRRYRERRKAA